MKEITFSQNARSWTLGFENGILSKYKEEANYDWSNNQGFFTGKRGSSVYLRTIEVRGDKCREVVKKSGSNRDDNFNYIRLYRISQANQKDIDKYCTYTQFKDSLDGFLEMDILSLTRFWSYRVLDKFIREERDY